MLVRFHDLDNSVQLNYSVIISKDQNGFVFVKHRDRDTWEIPGGHIEDEETPLEAAKRELIEETGAVDFKIKEVCNYSVTRNNIPSYGRLFFADIESYSDKLDYEIVCVKSFKELPDSLTYPNIQPFLFKEVIERLKL